MNASYNYAGANPTLGPYYLTECKSLYGDRLCLILRPVVNLSTNNSLGVVAQKHSYRAQRKKQGGRRRRLLLAISISVARPVIA
jgi:hypothetical protein